MNIINQLLNMLTESISFEEQIRQLELDKNAIINKIRKTKEELKTLKVNAASLGAQSGIKPQYQPHVKRLQRTIEVYQQELDIIEQRRGNIAKAQELKKQQPERNKKILSHEERMIALRAKAEETHKRRSEDQKDFTPAQKSKITLKAFDDLILKAKANGTTAKKMIIDEINDLTLDGKKPLDMTILSAHFNIPTVTMYSWLKQLSLDHYIKLQPKHMGTALPSHKKIKRTSTNE